MTILVLVLVAMGIFFWQCSQHPEMWCDQRLNSDEGSK